MKLGPPHTATGRGSSVGLLQAAARAGAAPRAWLSGRWVAPNWVCGCDTVAPRLVLVAVVPVCCVLGVSLVRGVARKETAGAFAEVL